MPHTPTQPGGLRNAAITNNAALNGDGPVQQGENVLPSNLVCTLTDSAQVGQILEWTDLGPLALTSERIDGGVASTYPLAIADHVEALAVREADCCGSWLTATTARFAEHVRLEVTTTNPDGVPIIVATAGLAP